MGQLMAKHSRQFIFRLKFAKEPRVNKHGATRKGKCIHGLVVDDVERELPGFVLFPLPKSIDESLAHLSHEDHARIRIRQQVIFRLFAQISRCPSSKLQLLLRRRAECVACHRMCGDDGQSNRSGIVPQHTSSILDEQFCMVWTKGLPNLFEFCFKQRNYETACQIMLIRLKRMEPIH